MMSLNFWALALSALGANAVQHGLYARSNSTFNATTTAPISESSSKAPPSSSSPGVSPFILQDFQTDNSTSNESTGTRTLQSTVTEVLTLVPVNRTTSTGLISGTAPGSSANATITGFAAAQSCNIASLSWSSSHLTSTPYNSTFLATSTYTVKSMVGNVSTFTLCDQWPRADIPDPIQTSSFVYNDFFVFSSSFLPSTITDPPPSCTIGSADCSSLWSSFLTSGASWTGPFFDQPPACPTPSSLGSSFCPEDVIYTYSDHPPCTFNAGNVRLVYFPVEVSGNVSARMCNNYTTVTTNATGLVTAEALGTTFTSGTAYISFESLAASDRCGYATGSAMENFFIPVQSGDVSSLCAEYEAPQFGGLPTSLNFADLASPVPLSAYSCMAKCDFGFYLGWEELCPTIYNDYAPVLAYPTAVTNLQPAWRSCGFDASFKNVNLLWDPPIALQPASVAASVTLPASPISTPAQTAHQTTGNSSPTANPTTASPTTTPVESPSSSESAPQKDPTTTPVAENTSQNSQTPSQTPSVSPADESGPSEKTSVQSTNDPSNAGQSSVGSPQSTVNTASLAVSQADPTTQQPPPAQPTPTTNALTILSQALSSTAAPIATVGSVTISQNPSGPGIVAGSSTVTPGQSTEIGGTPVSVGSTQVIVGGSSTIPIAAGPSAAGPSAAESPAPLATVGGVTVLPDPSSAGGVVVGSATLTPGQSTVVSGIPISVGSSEVVVAGSTAPIAQAQSIGTAAPLATVGSITVSANPSGDGVLAGTATLTPGQSTLISGTPISVGSSVVVVAGSTIPITPDPSITVAAVPAASPLATVGSLIVSADPSAAGVIVGSATLTSGQTTVIAGTTISVGSSQVVLGSSTIPLPVITAVPASITVSRSGTEYIVAGQTVAPGSAITVNGETISALSDGSLVLGDPQTISLGAGQGTTVVGVAAPQSTTGLTVSHSGSVYIIDGSTLTPGQIATVGNVPVSELSNGAGIVVAGSETVSLGNGAATTISPAASVSEAVLTIGSSTITAYGVPGSSAGEVIVAGTTLSIGGPAATISGETLSLGSSGIVEVGGGGTTTVGLAASNSQSTKSASSTTRSTGSGSTASTPSTLPKNGATRPISPRGVWLSFGAMVMFLMSIR